MDIAFLEVSRQSQGYEENGAKQIQWDLNQPLDPTLLHQLEGLNTLIHCAPIWLLPDHLETLNGAGLQRLIVFSSTSVLSKAESSDPSEQRLVSQLSDSEQQIHNFCSEHKMALTILRPSMIYGYGLDHNVSHIARFIRRFGFFVLVGAAQGLRQPVHADDLVDACLNIIDKQITFGKTYNLAGAETISYRIMVERIFDGLGRPKRIFSLPLSIFRLALMIASKLGRFSYTPEMADRMMRDLNYDYDDALRDFSYRPRFFLENADQDLV